MIPQDPQWQAVLAVRHAVPAKLLAAVEPLLAECSSPPDKAEIINYYLSLHPKLASLFAWKKMAEVSALIESNPAWRKFFATDFKTPQDFIAAIPKV